MRDSSRQRANGRQPRRVRHLRRQATHLELHRDTDQELSRAERLDEVVGGAGPKPSIVSSMPLRAVSKITGMVRVRSSDLSSRHSSMPERCGIMTSAKTRSGSCAWMADSAALPSDTAVTL